MVRHGGDRSNSSNRSNSMGNNGSNNADRSDPVGMSSMEVAGMVRHSGDRSSEGLGLSNSPVLSLQGLHHRLVRGLATSQDSHSTIDISTSHTHGTAGNYSHSRTANYSHSSGNTHTHSHTEVTRVEAVQVLRGRTAQGHHGGERKEGLHAVRS